MASVARLLFAARNPRKDQVVRAGDDRRGKEPFDVEEDFGTDRVVCRDDDRLLERSASPFGVPLDADRGRFSRHELLFGDMEIGAVARFRLLFEGKRGGAAVC